MPLNLPDETTFLNLLVLFWSSFSGSLLAENLLNFVPKTAETQIMKLISHKMVIAHPILTY